MKKVLLIIMLICSMNIYSLDINKDDFCLVYDIQEYIAGYNGKIFHIQWYDEKPMIIEKIDRPARLENDFGYIDIKFRDWTCHLVIVNGNILKTYKTDEVYNDFNTLYGQPQIKSVSTSSFLTEKTKKIKTEYKAINSLFRLTAEKGVGFYLQYNGLPWIPDIKNDSNPSIEIELESSVDNISILPGFLDFERQNLFRENSRIKKIQIIDPTENREIGVYTLEDKVGYTTITFYKRYKHLKINLLEYYAGTKYSDPCMGSIIFVEDYEGNFGQNHFKELIATGIFDE